MSTPTRLLLAKKNASSQLPAMPEEVSPLQVRTAALKARRETMTPEDKKKLLESPDKVIGAALSLHVVHDVALADLDHRLEAWGVEEKMRRRAIETIRSKTHHPLIKDDGPKTQEKAADERDDVEARLVKYRKMLSVGVPIGAAVAAAKRDGLDAVALNRLSPPPAASQKPVVEESKDDGLSAYRKMLGMGVPPMAVRQRMFREGKSDREADLIVPLEKHEKALPVPSIAKIVPSGGSKQLRKVGGGDKATAEKDCAVEKKKPLPAVKPLHWEKLEVEDVSKTIWRSSNSNCVEDDDLALLEEMFSTKPPAMTEKKKPLGSLKKVSVLESRRASNVAIGLTYFARKVKSNEDEAILDAMRSLEFLDGPSLRSFRALLPTREEIKAVQAYSGDVAKLARPERFFLTTLRHDNLSHVVDAGIFLAEFEDQATEARKAAGQARAACDAVLRCSDLPRVLASLLAFGNKLNSGRAAGDAKGISIKSLERCCVAKANDGTTLLDFLATVLGRKQQAHVLDFVDGLPDLVQAAKYADDEYTSKVHFSLDHSLKKTLKTLEKQRSVDEKSRFVVETERGCRTASAAVKALKVDLDHLTKSKTDLCAYLASDDVKDIFNTLHTFVLRCKEARDKYQRRLQAAISKRERQQAMLAKQREQQSQRNALSLGKREALERPALRHRAVSAPISSDLIAVAAAPAANFCAPPAHPPSQSMLRKPASNNKHQASDMTLSLSKCRTAFNQKNKKVEQYDDWLRSTEEGDSSIQRDYEDSDEKPSLPPCKLLSPRSLAKLSRGGGSKNKENSQPRAGAGRSKHPSSSRGEDWWPANNSVGVSF